MTERKWMMHIDIRCGSIEYIGTDLPPETLVALVETLTRLGMVSERNLTSSKEEK